MSYREYAATVGIPSMLLSTTTRWAACVAAIDGFDLENQE